jgi:two-component system copper resistance phosphate regulon response regulator CusR
MMATPSSTIDKHDASRAPHSMTSAQPERPSVLVVEDEARIRELVSLHLQLEGLAPTEATDGDSGLSLARSRKFDLIILDLMLPGLDGVTVCRAIRRESANAETPILMLTARREESDKVLGLDSGADDYLTKPFGIRELLARIRALLRRGRTVEMLRFGIADLDLDIVTRKVTRGGRIVDLTAREFELLEYLMRHEGQVVMRDMLARDVWKETARGTPLNNVIDVHIARLRRKVDVEPFEKLIHTVRGVGFMLKQGEP